LGNDPERIWANYLNDQHCFVQKNMDKAATFVAPLDVDSFAKIEVLRQSDSKYKFLDNSVLYAMEASRSAIAQELDFK
jgi:hypothetical protein